RLAHFQLNLLLQPLCAYFKLLLFETRTQIVGLCSPMSKWNHQAQAAGIFRVLCRETLVQRLTGSSCQIRVVTGESRARVEAEDVDARQESVACETCTDVLVGEILLRDPQFRPFLESSRKHRVQFRHVSLVWLGQLVDCVDGSGIQLRINSLAQQLFELSFLKLKVGLRNN